MADPIFDRLPRRALRPPEHPRSTQWIALSARHSVRGRRPPPDRVSAGRSLRPLHRGDLRRARLRIAVSTPRRRATPLSGVALQLQNGWPACVRFRALATRGPPVQHRSVRRAGCLWRGWRATYARRRSICTGVGSPNRWHHASGGRRVTHPGQGSHVPGGRGVIPPEVRASYLRTRGVMPTD